VSAKVLPILLCRKHSIQLSSVVTGGWLIPETKLQVLQSERWNTINQLGFCQFVECQAPRTNPKSPAETQSPPIKNFLATVLIQWLESQKHRQFQLTVSHKRGRIQPVSVGGAISAILGSQDSFRVHYCKKDEVYFTALLWQSNGQQNALISQILFSELQKIMVKRATFVGFSGRLPQSPPYRSDPGRKNLTIRRQ